MAEDIDFDKLPDKFVLKCNHNSGKGMCICKDKSKLDIANVRRELSDGLKEKYFYKGREWPYKNIKPRIVCEKYIESSAVTLRIINLCATTVSQSIALYFPTDSVKAEHN